MLFPYARARLPSFCSLHADDPVMGEVARLAPDRPVLETLQGWMDEDAKITPLKTIQGMIWKEGYLRGDLTGDLYADVTPALKRWSKAGLRLYVYSSGSEAAQKLLFGHTAAGDLKTLFQGFFDTPGGGQARGCQLSGDMPRRQYLAGRRPVFVGYRGGGWMRRPLAGLQTCQLVRTADGTIASARHPTAGDFEAVAEIFKLPRGAATAL